MGRFFEVLLNALRGNHVGEPEFDGEDLERWAIKLMLGLAASGNNVRYPDGSKLPVLIAPDPWVRALFSEDDLPDGAGFYYVPKPMVGITDHSVISWQLNHHAEGNDAGLIFGITIKILSCFQYLTTPAQRLVELNGIRVLYRPGGFVFAGLGTKERGRIRLRWGGVPSDRASLILPLVDPRRPSK